MKKRVLAILLTLVMVIALLPVMTASSEDPSKNYIESVGVRFRAEFNMIYVEGGTFTLGWEEGTPGEAPDDTYPVPDVKVSDYWISDTVVTQNLWAAVMGAAQPAATTRNNAHVSNTFYDVQEFMARLYILTGKVYYLPTEAQWEYAAKGGQPGHALGHNLMPFPSSLVQSEVAIPGTGPVKSRLPNILGIYDLSGCGNHGEWTWNSWNTTHIGGEDPTGIGGPIHSQKTRRGGLSSTGRLEYHSRLIRSIDGTGPSFRIALSADQSSVPPGMTLPREIHVPKLDDRDTPNSYRDPRWVTGDELVWEGHYQGYGGGAMKVWETGEIVLRPHDFNGYDPGDIVGQWYSFNNYGLVIIPNADSPNPDKSRMLIPYMFLDDFTVSTINDRRNINTAGSKSAGVDVVWPDIYMAPTGRLNLKSEANLRTDINTSKPFAPAPPEQFGQDYAAHPYFGGTYELIQKPVVPGLVATADLAAGVGIVAPNHQLWNIQGAGNTAGVFPTDVRSQDTRLVDGPDCGWWMGYGFGGIHTYRKDFDLGGNFRHSVYEAQPGTNISPQMGGLARGPWYTVNDMFLRTQINAGGTSYVDYLYLVVPDMDGNVLNTSNFPLRHLSYMSYERGDSRIFHLRENKDVERHPYEQAGLTGFGGMGNTTWRMAPSARRACTGIPTGATTWQTCGRNVMTCICPVYCRICESHFHNAFPVTTAELTLTAPVKRAAPEAVVASLGVEAGAVTWSPAVTDMFAPSTVYTATFEIGPAHGYLLNNDLTVTLNGVAVTVDGDLVSFTFPETEPPPIAATVLKIGTAAGAPAAALVSVGRNRTIQFNVIASDDAWLNLATWSTSNASLATVDENGLVTIKNMVGNVTLTITDRYSGLTSSIILRIS